MKITNEFTVHTPIDRAWEVLTDLPGIAPCLPGAQLTGVDGDVYRGKVKVKVGPVVSDFAGTARFTEKDDAAYRAVIDAKGRDARAGGNASALVTAVLAPSGEATLVTVDTDLKISGKLAQFGSGMIKEISNKLLAQFVTNLEAKLAPGTAAPETPAPETPAAETPAAETPAAEPPAAEAAAPETAAAEATVPESPAAEVPAAEAPAAAPAAAPRSAVPAATATKDEPEALDLLAVAGSSVYKRLIPVAVGVVVVVGVIVWLVARG